MYMVSPRGSVWGPIGLAGRTVGTRQAKTRNFHLYVHSLPCITKGDQTSYGSVYSTLNQHLESTHHLQNIKAQTLFSIPSITTARYPSTRTKTSICMNSLSCSTALISIWTLRACRLLCSTTPLHDSLSSPLSGSRPFPVNINWSLNM